MNMPNFKDIIQKLSVFKNNLSLLVPVIIVLVSVLLFIPTQLMSSKLRKDVDQESIIKGIRRVGILDGKAVSRIQYEMEAERQKAHANDANEIADLARQSTQRELLSYDIFPEPDPCGFSGLIFQKFGQQFRSGIEELIARVNGRDCPTEDELNRGLEASSARSIMRRGSSSMSAYSDYSRSSSRGTPGRTMMLSEIDRMIVNQICIDRAGSISAYVNPIDLKSYEYWVDYKYDDKEKAIEDCWYHQLSYWVIEDIFDTIAAMNSQYDSVLTAPVKRLLQISFTMGLKRPGSGGSAAIIRGFGRRRTGQKKDESDKPGYVLTDNDALTQPCTGRYSEKDGDIDVIHFNFAVVVGAKEVLPFMQELCSAKQHKFTGYPNGRDQPQTYKHNQITILESKIASINPNDLAHRYYRYGEDSVVELNLICEYILNKKGYEDIKPESVKKTLAGEEQTTGQ